MALVFRDLKADEIDCRVATVSDKGVTLLLYKDARCDMNILDETVGAFNWQREHSRDNANCKVSIWDEEKEQWISKEDTGTESNTEAAKGLASDSFKRACFNWGIGRELYTAPFIWIKSEDCNITQKNGKPVTYDKFCVREITITDKRITGLTIYSINKKQIVYTYGKAAGKTEPVATSKPQEAKTKQTADPETEARRAAYQDLIEFCEYNGLNIKDICKSNNLTKESTADDFRMALTYARTIVY